MPRILIRELDETKAGSAAESNFTVLVPGVIGTPTSTENVWDDNDVYECKNESSFLQYIGKAKAIASGSAVAAELTNIGTEELPEYNKTISAHDFYVTYKGKLYTAEELTSGSIGYLKAKIDDILYKFTLVSDDAVWNADTKYSVIESGKEGTDASDIVQMGNQIAYELVKLGYTVLFKKFDSSKIEDLGKSDFWEPLKDKSIYNFRYVISGIINDYDSGAAKNVYLQLKSLVSGSDSDISNNGRGDCVALLDIPEDRYNSDTTKKNAVECIKEYAKNVTNAFCAWFAPTITYYGIDETIYENSKFPASFHYLACTIKSLEQYPEWYAISGYNRGIADLVIKNASYKFGEKAINSLQPRSSSDAPAVNVIATEKDSLYMWGNRTACSIGSELVASNFLNVRQLCSTIKKQIYSTCRKLSFEPNSGLLWLNFCNSISPTLENMLAQEGIKDYKFEQKETSLKAKLFAVVRIIPIEAVEDFEIAVRMEDNFDETNISIDEKLTGTI